jgi:hypothetical protein
MSGTSPSHGSMLEPIYIRVALARRLLQRRSVLGRPAFCDPLAEGGAACCQLRERQEAELPAALHLAVKGIGISLDEEAASALAAVFSTSERAIGRSMSSQPTRVATS